MSDHPKKVPLTYYDSDGNRHVIGEVSLGDGRRTDEIIAEIELGDTDLEVEFSARFNEKYRPIVSVDCDDFSIGAWAQAVERRSGLVPPCSESPQSDA